MTVSNGILLEEGKGVTKEAGELSRLKILNWIGY
jgi:hypothetical protein